MLQLKLTIRRNGEDLSLWSADDSQQATSLYARYGAKDTASSSGSPTDATSVALMSSSAASSQTLQAPLKATPKGIASGTDVSPRLLLDGARAPAAFCRPFPIATVGDPIFLEFDIRSTVFKLVVRVRPDDVPGETEIYVPFIHYARDLVWTAESDGWSTSSSQSSQLSITTNDGTPILTKDRQLELSLNVKASAGTWTTRGQYLYWTYPIPARPTKYTIEISRAGGAMALNLPDRNKTWWETMEMLGCIIS